MTTYDLTTLPTDTAIKLVMKDFGFSKTDAAQFVQLAQGKGADDVVTTKAAKLPKLGTGARFAKLEKKLSAKGAANPGALAGYIGRKKFGAKKMAKLSAHGKAYGGLGNTTFGPGNKKTGSLGLTKAGDGLKKTGSLGNTVFGAGNKKTGSLGMTQTGSGNKRTGALPGKVNAGSGNAKTGSLGTEAKVHNRIFKIGRKISLHMGKTKGYDPKA